MRACVRALVVAARHTALCDFHHRLKGVAETHGLVIANMHQTRLTAKFNIVHTAETIRQHWLFCTVLRCAVPSCAALRCALFSVQSLPQWGKGLTSSQRAPTLPEAAVVCVPNSHLGYFMVPLDCYQRTILEPCCLTACCLVWSLDRTPPAAQGCSWYKAADIMMTTTRYARQCFVPNRHALTWHKTQTCKPSLHDLA